MTSVRCRTTQFELNEYATNDIKRVVSVERNTRGLGARAISALSIFLGRSSVLQKKEMKGRKHAEMT